MKRWIITGFAVCLLLIGQMGCGGQDAVYLEEYLVSEDTETLIENTLTDTQEIEEVSCTTQLSEQEKVCYVYVCGAVCAPGVYELPVGSRIYEALALAGGMTEEASVDFVNQAEIVADGQMIRIPTEAEVEAGIEFDGETLLPSEADSKNGDADSRINLNTAGTAELMTLPGIGESKAMSILAYRENHGAFSSVEDVMKVEGIKEGVYNRIKDYIRVN